MSTGNSKKRISLASSVWKWGTLLLVGIFITFSSYLTVSINNQSSDVVKNVHAVSAVNKLRKSVRSLSKGVIRSDTSKVFSWSLLYDAYERSRAGVDISYARKLGYSVNIARSDTSVALMAGIYEELSISDGNEMTYGRFIEYMNQALDELEIAIDKLKSEQAIHSHQLNEKLNLLWWLLVLTCLLVVFIAVLFWKYQQGIIAHRKAEEALGKASVKIFDLYNNAPCGYHSLDVDGVFVEINATELRWLGYKREEVVGKLAFSDVVTPEGAIVFRKLYSEFMQSGTTPELEFLMVRKNGTTFPVLLRASAVYDEEGKYIKSRSTVLDITERKMVEEENQNKNVAILNAYKKLEITAHELEAVNKELESFSYSISHDLRAPLRAINSYSQILEEEYGGRLDEEGLRLLNIVKGSALKMGNLIDDLLALARLGKQEIKKNVIDMNELVQSTIRELERNQPSLNVTFTIDDLPPAWGDYNLLTQVMYNLLSNAVKYSSKKEEPKVQVGAKALAEEHIYYVKDNGTGFDMKYASKLFGVFQRLHHSNEFEGTGVGLAIVHRIITRHGGRVWAEAEPGKGAVFYFSLPVK